MSVYGLGRTVESVSSFSALPTHVTGSLIVVYLYCATSATLPAIAAGWNLHGVYTDSANSQCAALVWKIAESSGEVPGTWTGWSGAYAQTFRDSKIGGFRFKSGATNQHIIPALPLANPSNTSQVVRVIATKNHTSNYSDNLGDDLVKATDATDSTTYKMSLFWLQYHAFTGLVAPQIDRGASGDAGPWITLTLEIQADDKALEPDFDTIVNHVNGAMFDFAHLGLSTSSYADRMRTVSANANSASDYATNLISYTGNVYFEVKCVDIASTSTYVRLSRLTSGVQHLTINAGGVVTIGGGGSGNTIAAWNNDDDVLSVAVNAVGKRAWYRVNGGNWNNDANNSPSSNTGGYVLNGSGPLQIRFFAGLAGDTYQYISGPEENFHYAVPSNFVPFTTALNTPALFHDDFVYADNTELEDTANWDSDGAIAGALIVEGERLKSNTASDSGSIYTAPDFGNLNSFVEYTASHASEPSGSFAICRLTTGGDFIGVRNDADIIEIYRRVGGTYTSLYQSNIEDYFYFNEGDRIRLEVAFGYWYLRVNGRLHRSGLIGSSAITDFGTRQGIIARGELTDPLLDNFVSGNFNINTDIQYVGSAGADGDSANFPIHMAGDLLMVYAWNDAGTTVPTLPGGWTNISSGTVGGATAYRCAWKRATAVDTEFNTWTDATAVIGTIHRGVNQVAPIQQFSANSSSNTTLAFSSLTAPLAHTWGVMFAAHQHGNTNIATNYPYVDSVISQPRVTLTNADTTLAAWDTNQAVTSGSVAYSTTLTGTTGISSTIVVGLTSALVNVLSPTGIATGAPTVANPTVTIPNNALTATGIATGAPVVANPALVQIHAMIPCDINRGFSDTFNRANNNLENSPLPTPIYIANVVSNAFDDRTTTSLERSANTISSDALISICYAKGANTFVTTPPSDFLYVEGFPVSVAAANNDKTELHVMWARAGVSTANVVYTHSATANTQAALLSVRHALDAGDPIDVVGITATPYANATSNSVAPSVSTTAAAEMLLHINGNSGGLGALTAPSGFTEVFDSYLYIASKVLGASGATGTSLVEDANGGASPESIFDRATQGGTNTVSDTGLVLGTVFTPVVDGTVTHVWFWKTSADTITSRQVAIYPQGGGTALATATTSGETTGTSGWRQVALSSPLSVLANTQYVVAVQYVQGSYSSTLSYFTANRTGPGGNIVGPSSGSSLGNGRYSYSGGGAAVVYPNSSFNDSTYWADVEFIPGGVAGGGSEMIAAHVAIKPSTKAWKHDGAISGAASISNNVINNNTGSDSGSLYYLDVGSREPSLSFTVGSIPATPGSYTVLKAQNANNYTGFRLANTSGPYLQVMRVAGGEQQSLYDAALTVAAGNTLKIESFNDEIKVYVNNAISQTISRIPTNQSNTQAWSITDGTMTVTPAYLANGTETGLAYSDIKAVVSANTHFIIDFPTFDSVYTREAMSGDTVVLSAYVKLIEGTIDGAELKVVEAKGDGTTVNTAYQNVTITSGNTLVNSLITTSPFVLNGGANTALVYGKLKCYVSGTQNVTIRAHFNPITVYPTSNTLFRAGIHAAEETQINYIDNFAVDQVGSAPRVDRMTLSQVANITCNPITIGAPVLGTLTTATYRSYANSNPAYSSRSSTSVAKPAGTAEGDIVLIALFAGRGTMSGLTDPAISGFTQIGTTVLGAQGTTFYGKFGLFWKRAGASEPSTYDFDHAGSTLSTSMVAVAISGASAAGSPIDAYSQAGGLNSLITAPGITPAGINQLLFWFSHDWRATGALSPPTGFTERFDHLVYVANKEHTSGATGDITQTISNNSSEPWAVFLTSILNGTVGPTVTVAAGMTLTGVDTDAPVVGNPTLGIIHNFTPTGVATDAPAVSTATLNQIHLLGNIATISLGSATTVGTPALGTIHNLTGTGVTSSPVVATTALGQVHLLGTLTGVTSTPVVPAVSVGVIINATATGVTSTPVVDTPALVQIHVINATGVATGAPVAPTTALGQVHALTATGVTSTPVVATTAIGQIHNFTATGVATGAPVVGNAAIGGINALTLTGVSTGAPTVDTPTVTRIHNFTATGVVTGAPVTATSALGQSHVLGDSTAIATDTPSVGTLVFGQKHLITISLVTATPVVGNPILHENQILALSNCIGSAPVMGNAALNQNHVLELEGVDTGEPLAGTILTTLLPINIIMQPITIGVPTFGQKHAVVIDTPDFTAPSVGSPTIGQTHPIVLSGLTISPTMPTVPFNQIHPFTIDVPELPEPTVGELILLPEGLPPVYVMPRSIATGAPRVSKPLAGIDSRTTYFTIAQEIEEFKISLPKTGNF